MNEPITIIRRLYMRGCSREDINYSLDIKMSIIEIVCDDVDKVLEV